MFRLIAVSDRSQCPRDYLQQIADLFDWGVTDLILREKNLPVSEYRRLAEQVLAVAEEKHCRCILHNFVDVAKETGADAIHLPIPVAEKQTGLHAFFHTVGMSTHSIEQVRQAEKLGADYVTFGHVFPSTCKPGLAPRGISMLEEICAASSVPVYAIGGITSETIAQVRQAGAAGACIMSAAMKADQREIRRFLQESQLFLRKSLTVRAASVCTQWKTERKTE